MTVAQRAEEGRDVSSLRESLAHAELQVAETDARLALSLSAQAEAQVTLAARTESFERDRAELLDRVEHLTARAERAESELRGIQALATRLEEDLTDRQ